MDNQSLSPHFSLFEFTQTSQADLLEANQEAGLLILPKLKELATFAEGVRGILKLPLKIHSAFRCDVLNTRLGSRPTSQHLLGEAIDFNAVGMTLGDAFEALKAAARRGDFKFGELIHETAARDYGVADWIHASRGVPVRDPLKCGEVLVMENGVYQLVGQIREAV